MAVGPWPLDLASTFTRTKAAVYRSQTVGHVRPLWAQTETSLDPPSSMKLPNETLQQIYAYLSPQDYNAARHACRSWFLASLDRGLLIRMLKRGGWWSSMLQIMTPLNIARLLSLNQERIMSKWISRECHLSSLKKSAFREVGYTDFSGLVPGTAAGTMHGALVFTGSLCGRFLLVTHGRKVIVFELSHSCSRLRSPWSVPLRPRTPTSRSIPRPVATVVCPRRVISSTMMDSSAGRHTVAILMEGRMGMVCDILAERTAKEASNEASGPSTSNANASLSSTPACPCRVNPVSQAPPIEEGLRWVYNGICHPDDPPRSVALCPRRNCVAFGCSAGIELHWVDALTNQDLSRWFPLASPSDYLYFLPPRRGVDTEKKLRLISSAAALGNAFGPVGHYFQAFDSSLSRVSRNGVVSAMGAGTGHDVQTVNNGNEPSQRACVRPRDLLDQGVPADSVLRRVSAASADHYRAIPLSDGYHILFTDPRTGNLCLGTDAPVGALNRLIRKVWFRPPASVSSTSPLLYTAGADTRHGVRVAATFSVGGESRSVSHGGPQRSLEADRQIVVFYTIPPDMFHDISQTTDGARGPKDEYGGSPAEEYGGSLEWIEWRPEENYGEIDVFGSLFHDSNVYPLEVQGQSVAICSNLVELVLDSGPDVVLWAFSAEGWARTWSMDVGRQQGFSYSAVQQDGSIREVDHDHDIVMAETEVLPTTSDVCGTVSVQKAPEKSYGTRWMQEFTAPNVGRYQRLMANWDGDRMSGTVSVDLVEEVSGITRMDVELR